MKGYVKKPLKQFLHEVPKKPVHGPIKFNRPEYGKKVKYAKNDTEKTVDKKLKSKIQSVFGKFLYSGQAIDNTTIHALNELCIKATSATEETKETLCIFLDYLAIHREAQIIYRASDMQLQIDSDAAYLVNKNARSRAGGYNLLPRRSRWKIIQRTNLHTSENHKSSNVISSRSRM